MTPGLKINWQSLAKHRYFCCLGFYYYHYYYYSLCPLAYHKGEKKKRMEEDNFLQYYQWQRMMIPLFFQPGNKKWFFIVNDWWWTEKLLECYLKVWKQIWIETPHHNLEKTTTQQTKPMTRCSSWVYHGLHWAKSSSLKALHVQLLMHGECH